MEQIIKVNTTIVHHREFTGRGGGDLGEGGGGLGGRKLIIKTRHTLTVINTNKVILLNFLLYILYIIFVFLSGQEKLVIYLVNKNTA